MWVWQPLNPSAAAGQTIAVGQVIETDFAQAVAWAPKNRLVAQVTETNLAQAIGRLKTRTVGQVFETDFAQAVTVAPLRRLVAQVSEVNLAQVMTVVQAGAAAVGRALYGVIHRRWRGRGRGR